MDVRRTAAVPERGDSCKGAGYRTIEQLRVDARERFSCAADWKPNCRSEGSVHPLGGAANVSAGTLDTRRHSSHGCGPSAHCKCVGEKDAADANDCRKIRWNFRINRNIKRRDAHMNYANKAQS